MHETNLSLKNWLRASLFSLLLVAILGVIMRYKIAYSLPFINQRNLLHAHSHFAFAGWITQALMTLLTGYLVKKGVASAFKRYKVVLYVNLVTAYGMLFSFPFEGYGPVSITFSTLSIFVSYWFAIVYCRDLNRLGLKSPAHKWFKTSVVFNAISSIGAFYLAYMMASKSIEPGRYLASIYFFLHFQYNGWFFFACMGLLADQLLSFGVSPKKLNSIYFLFAIAAVPAYLLSALWLPVPQWVFGLVVIAVMLQLAGWALTIVQVKNKLPALRMSIDRFPLALFAFCGIAFTIKLCLQTGSVIPSLSKLAFGFRPIVIGYLHLVLLGVITLFIISFMIAQKLIDVNGWMKKGMIIFTSGIIINEILLMIQGISDLNYQPVPSINLLLLIAAGVLLLGILIINLSQKRRI